MKPSKLDNFFHRR